MKRLLLAAALSAQLALVSTAASAGAGASADDTRFEAIYGKEWKWRQEQTGEADEDNDTSANQHRLPSVDAASQAARLKVWEDVLRQLDGVDMKQLSAQNQVNFAVYRAQVENLAAEVRLRGYEMPFNSDSSFWSNLGFMTRRPLHTVEDYRAYIDRLRDVPRYFDQNIDNMRAGLARGFSVPRAVLDGRDVSIAAVAQVKDPAQSNFYEPFKRMPASIPADEQARAARGRPGRDPRTPGARPTASCCTFFREEYVPQARTTLGGGADAGRPGVLPPADPRVHDPGAGSRSRSTRSACRKWRASRARWTRSSSRSGSRETSRRS